MKDYRPAIFRATHGANKFDCGSLMPGQDPHAELTQVVADLNAAGAPWGWPADEIARVAIRRWSSFRRRHERSKRVRKEDRIADLAKGLISHFEPDVPYTHPSEWCHLAGKLGEVLSREGD